jgi:hypothetical protein|uniref:Uncharacterized protein n=1 Tax=Picea glauca TaxID=3330 RepID=A0A101M3E4_PICGL|nr:hypothetical protein ABT39_MTgene62 [Picea glauca]
MIMRLHNGGYTMMLEYYVSYKVELDPHTKHTT